MKMQYMLGVAIGALAVNSASAQLPEAGATSFGMAGNFMAAATGYEAPAFNPAMLGIRAPKFSISLLSIGGSTGLDPIKLNDITKFEGTVIPAATKEDWLKQVGTGGRERGSLEGGISLVALNIGHLGFQVGAIGSGEANINQDAAEALLFGNAGRTGTARSFNFSGSNGSGSAFGVGAVSLGIPIMSKKAMGGEGKGDMMGDDEETFALGITGKYITGIGAGRAADNGSTITPDNIKAAFPSIFTNSDDVGSAGSGFGLDLGAAYTTGRTTFSGAVRNVVNTFEWETAKFRSTAGTVSFDGTTSKTDFNKVAYAQAPASLRTALEAEKFKPEIAFGIAHELHSLLVTADASSRVGDDGIQIGPKSRVGVGAEFTGIPILKIRGGVAAVTGGSQAAFGLGIRLGKFEIAAAVSTRSGDNGTETGGMVTLFSLR